jgi:hypothetical protein
VMLDQVCQSSNAKFVHIFYDFPEQHMEKLFSAINSFDRQITCGLFGSATVESSPLVLRVQVSTPGLGISEIYFSSPCSLLAQSEL